MFAIFSNLCIRKLKTIRCFVNLAGLLSIYIKIQLALKIGNYLLSIFIKCFLQGTKIRILVECRYSGINKKNCYTSLGYYGNKL